MGKILPFDLGIDSGFQNAAEFIAVVMGIGCLAAMGITDTRVRIIGDNISSLSWSVKSSFRDGPSRNAAICMAMMGTQIGIDVEDGQHIAGSSNTVCDGLSRGKDPSEFRFAPSQCIAVDNVEGLSLLLVSCDPLRGTDTDDEFLDIWTRARRVCQLLTEGPPSSKLFLHFFTRAVIIMFL
jgi:hypothetical protein